MSISVQDAIRDILTSSNDLFNIVGDRIFPTKPEEDTELPYLIYWKTESSDPDISAHLQGAGTLWLYLIQLDWWTTSDQDEQAICSIVENLLHEYSSPIIVESRLVATQSIPEDWGMHGSCVVKVFFNKNN